MIYILHGDDTASSRKYLSGLVEGYQVTELDGLKLTIRDLEEKLLSTSLFEENKAVVIENLISKNPKKKDFVSFLNSTKTPILLILWENKKLTVLQTSGLNDAKVVPFLLPQNYFQFLDAFIPGKAKDTFRMYHDLLNTMSEEQIFYSLLKRLRLLVVISQNGKVAELEKMNDWQLGKLQKQVKMWSKEKLFSFYKKLQDTEIKLKSGKLPVGLSKHLDIMILSELT